MQRLAHVAGLAYLSESHLSVHAEYGPWLGLRAAISSVRGARGRSARAAPSVWRLSRPMLACLRTRARGGARGAHVERRA